MDNVPAINNDQVSDTVSRLGRFSRFGLVAALVGSFVIGMVVIAVIQSQSQAQSTVYQARQSPWRTLPAIPSTSVANEPRPSDNPGFASEPHPSNVQYVQEVQMVSEMDPTTRITRMVPRVRMVPTGRYPTGVSSETGQPLNGDLMQLASQYRSASPLSRESIGQQLTQKLTEDFDARHKEQVSRAEKLRTDLQQTEELLAKRLQLKSKIIERRVKELTGQQDELSWNPQAANANSRPNENLPSGVLPSSSLQYGSFAPSSNVIPPQYAQTQYPVPSMMSSNAYNSTFNPNNTLPSSDNNLQPPISNAPSLAPIRVAEEEPVPSSLTPPYATDTSAVPYSAAASTEPNADSKRSYMAVGLKLKKLIRDLERARENLGNAHPSLIFLENAIPETKTIWDFERQMLQTELESVVSEMKVVQKQSALAIDKKKRQEQRLAQGMGSVEESSDSERAVLAAERDLLQLEFRMRSTKNALQWMDNFEEKFLKSTVEELQPKEKVEEP